MATALAFIAGCGTAASSSTNGKPPASPATSAIKTVDTRLGEHLVLSGDISGVLTTGDNPQALTHDNPLPAFVENNGVYTAPAPSATQCSDFDASYGAGRDYVAVIVGMVGSKRVAITVEINENDPAYTTPGTALRPGNTNSGGSINVYEVGGRNRQWQQVYGPAQQEAVIVLHSDRTSGTVDAWLATTDQSQKLANATLHVHGDWRCG